MFVYTQADYDAYEESVDTRAYHTRSSRQCDLNHETETAPSCDAFDSLMAEFNDRSVGVPAPAVVVPAPAVVVPAPAVDDRKWVWCEVDSKIASA